MIMPYEIYSVVINKCQCEFKSEDKMEKQINEKKALVPKAFLCYKLIKRTPS